MRQDFRQKLLRALGAIFRVTEKVLGGTVFDDFALIHKNHAVGDLASKAHFMGDAHHGHAFVGQLHHHVQYFVNHFRVEGRRAGRRAAPHGRPAAAPECR